VEFARWYAATGGLIDPTSGVRGPLLFSSLEHHTPLVALQVLAQVPVLWIWDNVEPVAGFPAGTPSAWTADEQRELREFLQAVSSTRARVLLTSRRDEQDWLANLPARGSGCPGCRFVGRGGGWG
jgi:hypothetical protein